MADIHLYRALLFGRMKDEGGRMKEETAYPWESPAADLAAAETLINPGAPGPTCRARAVVGFLIEA